MRKNMFNETYLDESDSIVDFITDQGIETDELSAFIDLDDDGATYLAEVLDNEGPVFYVEGYTSEMELENELRGAGIDFVEMSE